MHISGNYNVAQHPFPTEANQAEWRYMFRNWIARPTHTCVVSPYAIDSVLFWSLHITRDSYRDVFNGYLHITWKYDLSWTDVISDLDVLNCAVSSVWWGCDTLQAGVICKRMLPFQQSLASAVKVHPSELTYSDITVQCSLQVMFCFDRVNNHNNILIEHVSDKT